MTLYNIVGKGFFHLYELQVCEISQFIMCFVNCTIVYVTLANAFREN